MQWYGVCGRGTQMRDKRMHCSESSLHLPLHGAHHRRPLLCCCCSRACRSSSMRRAMRRLVLSDSSASTSTPSSCAGTGPCAPTLLGTGAAPVAAPSTCPVSEGWVRLPRVLLGTPVVSGAPLLSGGTTDMMPISTPELSVRSTASGSRSLATLAPLPCPCSPSVSCAVPGGDMGARWTGLMTSVDRGWWVWASCLAMTGALIAAAPRSQSRSRTGFLFP